MRFQGHPNVEELSDLLKNESDRCVVIVAAAFFDETLAGLLGDTTDRAFNARIGDARDYGILTQNEHDDLHIIRRLRNRFAHNLRAATFDATAIAEVEGMATWRTAASAIERYRTLFPGSRERFLYAAGMIAFRLQHRGRPAPRIGPLSEPPMTDLIAWPPVISF
jgi:hypothetical protein